MLYILLITFAISITYTFVVYKLYIEIHLVQVLRPCSTGHSEWNKQKFNGIEEANGRAMESSPRRFSLPVGTLDRKRKVHVRHNLYLARKCSRNSAIHSKHRTCCLAGFRRCEEGDGVGDVLWQHIDLQDGAFAVVIL